MHLFDWLCPTSICMLLCRSVIPLFIATYLQPDFPASYSSLVVMFCRHCLVSAINAISSVSPQSVSCVSSFHGMPVFAPLIDFFMTKSVTKRNKNAKEYNLALFQYQCPKYINGAIFGLHIAAGALVEAPENIGDVPQ